MAYKTNNKPVLFSVLSATFMLIAGMGAHGQFGANLDESKVEPYTLPALLVTDNGRAIESRAQWEKIQRPAILKKFTENVYGKIPGKAKDVHYKINNIEAAALNGKATRKQITVYFTKGEAGPSMNILLYLPNNAKVKSPVFVGLNFDGNHASGIDTSIAITHNWKRVNKNKEPVRGEEARRWPVEEIINSGYGVATVYYEDLEPDNREGWKTGIRTTLKKVLNIEPDQWTAMGAWAWGLSRIIDYLETDDRVNAGQVIVTGHSRLGKAGLWAAMNDARFAMVVSNNSGEGGAALSRRNFGETVKIINTSFPHWFLDKYKYYNDRVDQLPVDQHMLLALAAPRPLYVASASEDLWADPKGEFLSALYAGPVYALYDKKGLATEEPPPADTPVGENIGYHMRTGPHDMLLYDWQQYIQFANKHFR